MVKMLRTHMVELRHHEEPRWPRECVGCGGLPDTSVTVADRTPGLGWVFSIIPTGVLVRRTAPCCTECRRSDAFTKWGRRVMFVAIVVGVMSAVLPWLKALGVTRSARKPLAFAAVGLALVPLYLWTLLSPRAVTIDAYTSSITYQFARREYADAFRRMN